MRGSSDRDIWAESISGSLARLCSTSHKRNRTECAATGICSLTHRTARQPRDKICMHDCTARTAEPMNRNREIPISPRRTSAQWARAMPQRDLMRWLDDGGAPRRRSAAKASRAVLAPRDRVWWSSTAQRTRDREDPLAAAPDVPMLAEARPCRGKKCNRKAAIELGYRGTSTAARFVQHCCVAQELHSRMRQWSR